MVFKKSEIEQLYEMIIGLEIHVELATKTKIFCGCSTAFGGAANTHTCPVCMGMPGTLPVLNEKVLVYAVMVGLATGCSVSRDCKFDRKNYFYPDNPQNYQISQLYAPICQNGAVEIVVGNVTKKIGIHEIHMEEDAGKMIHDEHTNCSMVDYNRAGVPLIEIVSEPDMTSAEEVIAYIEKLRMLIQYLGASDCKLNEGSMRVDVNLSVRRKGKKDLGTRTEMKNLNSFRSITRAISSEFERQVSLLSQGKEIVQETRRWDEDQDCSYPMRSKEDARDYRYFPDPDLAPIHISESFLQRMRKQLPEFQTEKMERYQREYQLPDYDIEIITGSKYLADLFEATVNLCKKPKKVSNWLMGETLRLLKEQEMEPNEIRFTPEHFAKLIQLTDDKVITNSVAKEMFEKMFVNDFNPVEYVEQQGLHTVQDQETLRLVIKKVIDENPKSVADYCGGKEKAIGFLVGHTMKTMKGQADPSNVTNLLKEMLELLK